MPLIDANDSEFFDHHTNVSRMCYDCKWLKSALPRPKRTGLAASAGQSICNENGRNVNRCTSSRKVMGEHVNSPVPRYLGWATFAVMTAATPGMLITS